MEAEEVGPGKQMAVGVEEIAPYSVVKETF